MSKETLYALGVGLLGFRVAFEAWDQGHVFGAVVAVAGTLLIAATGQVRS